MCVCVFEIMQLQNLNPEFLEDIVKYFSRYLIELLEKKKSYHITIGHKVYIERERQTQI